MPGTKMRRKCRPGIAQAAQIDDALDSGAFRRRAKIARRRHVALGKIGTRSEAVHEVIGDGDPAHGIRQRFRAKDIAHDQFDVAPPRSSLQARGVARQASHADTRLEQSRDKPPADVSGDTGDQHELLV